MFRKPNPSRRGLSLIEVLLALVFLMFGLAGVMELYLAQDRHITRGQRLARASSVAHSCLAQLQETGYSALAENIRLHANSPEALEAQIFPGLSPSDFDPDFRWNAHLRQEVRNGVPCIRIAVTAAPLEGPGRAGAQISREVVGYVAAP